MKTFFIKFELLSDAAFTRGDGLAGVVDSEVQHDELGCPYLSGRALKGILVNECADILAALPTNKRKNLDASAQHLFGQPGSSLNDQALWTIGDAQLPEDLRKVLQNDLAKRLKRLDESDDHKKITKMRQHEISAFRHATLESLTTLRRQTAMETSGVPKEHSLRTQRVILRQTPFEASLRYHGSASPEEGDLILLAACIKAFRRAGSTRNRGRGLIEARFLDEDRNDVTKTYFKRFKEEVI
jgi:hypothetical protein